jgi:hypothetical protein
MMLAQIGSHGLDFLTNRYASARTENAFGQGIIDTMDVPNTLPSRIGVTHFLEPRTT